jgi:hypothetical protein
MMGVRKVAKFSCRSWAVTIHVYLKLKLAVYVLPFQVCMNQKLGDLTNREHAPNVGRCLLRVLYSILFTERASLRQYNYRTISPNSSSNIDRNRCVNNSKFIFCRFLGGRAVSPNHARSVVCVSIY